MEGLRSNRSSWTNYTLANIFMDMVFDKWLDYRGNDLGVVFEEDSYLDIAIYGLKPPYGRETGGEYYALTDDYILFSNTSSFFL